MFNVRLINKFRTGNFSMSTRYVLSSKQTNNAKQNSLPAKLQTNEIFLKMDWCRWETCWVILIPMDFSYRTSICEYHIEVQPSLSVSSPEKSDYSRQCSPRKLLSWFDLFKKGFNLFKKEVMMRQVEEGIAPFVEPWCVSNSFAEYRILWKCT